MSQLERNFSEVLSSVLKASAKGNANCANMEISFEIREIMSNLRKLLVYLPRSESYHESEDTKEFHFLKKQA